jgi:hypothetical protein
MTLPPGGQPRLVKAPAVGRHCSRGPGGAPGVRPSSLVPSALVLPPPCGSPVRGTGCCALTEPPARATWLSRCSALGRRDTPSSRAAGSWTRSRPHTARWRLHPDGRSAGSSARGRDLQPAALWARSDPRRCRRGGWCRAARGPLSAGGPWERGPAHRHSQPHQGRLHQRGAEAARRRRRWQECARRPQRPGL